MKLLFIHDTYYTRADDRVYAHGAFPAALWAERYLSHFDHITVVGREKPGADVTGLPLSSHPGVDFHLVENINTPLRKLFCSAKISDELRVLVEDHDALVIRGPAELGVIAAAHARKIGKPYALELSGCGFENLWYHGSLVAKAYAPLKYGRVRQMVKQAAGVLYVTQDFLQKRYPTEGFAVAASNVVIMPKTRKEPQNDKFIIGLIGNYNNNLKGLDVAIKALAVARDDVPKFELRILGSGDKQRWSGDIRRGGLEEHITFYDPVASQQEVFDFLDRLELYIQPSRHEGLPRALIEAMSRGLPALASDAGGITELLPPEFIHPRGDYKTLARHIVTMLDQDERNRAGDQNFERSQDYAQDVLKEKRDQFYNRYKQKLHPDESQDP